MDLGKKIKSPSVAINAPEEKDAPKVTYPSLNLNDDQADGFIKEATPKIGDEFAATVRVKVTGMRHDDYGKSVTLDVMDLDDITPESEEQDTDTDGDGDGSGMGEDGDETKTLGYKRPKKSAAKELPSVGADFLDE